MCELGLLEDIRAREREPVGALVRQRVQALDSSAGKTLAEGDAMPTKKLRALAFWLTASLARQVNAGEPLPILPSEAPSETSKADGSGGFSDLAPSDDSVDERRHFNERLLQFGANLDATSQSLMLGVFAEANVWDRLAVSVGGGASLSGPQASASVRARPIVWGGEGKHLLNAFTLRAEYLIMRYGEQSFFCDHDCGVRFVSRTAQWGALSAGFEHQLWFGLTIRYDFGFARVISATRWECALDGRSAPCNGQAPRDDMMVTSLAISHAI